MLSSIARGSVGRRAPALIARNFSTTPSRAAAEVKKLGVVGAGQMVSTSHMCANFISIPLRFIFGKLNAKKL